MRQRHLFLCKPAKETSPFLADLWSSLLGEACALRQNEPALVRTVQDTVLSQGCFAQALGSRLAQKLASPELDEDALFDVIGDAFDKDPDIVEAAGVDLVAVRDRDPACPDLLTPLLYFKGFQALQGYRVAHWLWRHDRTHVARHLQSRISEVFAIDIHPAARLGRGILLDHGTGIVIGETAVVEDDVSMLHDVTLGGTGKERGDRHPKVRRGVLIGAGAKIFGNIEIGEGAKVGAGSIVLDPVEPHTTVVGVPARPVRARLTDMPALTMDHSLQPPDYVI